MSNESTAESTERAVVNEITISNYRSIGRSVTLKLDPLTVLVGPNGAGKSNVLDVFRFVADSMTMGLGGAIDARNGIEACRRWNRSSGGQPNNVSIAIKLSLPKGPASYSLLLSGSKMQEYWIKSERAVITDGSKKISFHAEEGNLKEIPDGISPSIDRQTLALPLVGGDRRFRSLFSTLRNFEVYSIYPNTLRLPVKYSAAKPMHRHGENWVSILKDQGQESWIPDLIAALKKLTGDIDNLRAERIAGHLVAQFHRTVQKKSGPRGTLQQRKSPSEKWFDAYQESDGTLRFAGIITALLQEPPLPVIGIEEPELTIHPGALDLLFDFLVQASRRSQVIVTTHSPDLLDRVSDASVRVVARDQNDGTTITPLLARQRQVVRDRLLTLGEVLRTEGLQQELEFPPGAESEEE